MNNNPNNTGNIDDILDILKKKKSEEPKNDAPTRMDTQAAKKQTPNHVSEVFGASEKKSVPQEKPRTSVYERGADSGISLDDFDELVARKTQPVKKENKKKRHMPGALKVLIYLICVISVSILISVTTIKVGNDVFAFVKSDDAT